MDVVFGVLIGWGFVLGGFGFFVYHLFILRKKAIPIKGKIIDFCTESAKSSSAKGMKTNYPIVEYTDPDDGQQYKYKSSIGRARAKGLGEELNILLYKKPDGTRRCERNSKLFLYVLPGLMGLIGIPIALISTGYLIENIIGLF